MFYKKEKENIYFGYNDKKLYNFNFNTKKFIGLAGKEMKHPPAFILHEANLDSIPMLETLRNYFRYENQQVLNLKQIESIVEATNVALNFDENIEDFSKLNTKDIIYALNFIKEHTHIWGSLYIDEDRVKLIKAIIFQKQFNLPNTITNYSLLIAIMEHKEITYYMYELQAMSNLGIRIEEYIAEFIDYCTMLELPFKKKGKSFCEYLDELTEIYNNKRDIAIQKKLQKCNNKLKFENDEYIVLVPNSVEQYQNEANSQNNCVMSYINQVAKNKTHIVFIRKKDNIDKTYITCEVDNNYNIKQYLLSCNRKVVDEEDLDFKYKYQRYLDTLKEL